MKFKMRCRKVGTTGEGWWEDYDKATDDAEKWCRDIIEYFNRTLRDGETAREILEVVVTDPTTATAEHQWRKTNSFTVRGMGGITYDTFQCIACGITARRYGTENHKRDPKYKAKVYGNCEDAKRRLEKRGKKPAISLATN